MMLLPIMYILAFITQCLHASGLESMNNSAASNRLKEKVILVAFFGTAMEYERRSIIRSVIANRYDPAQIDVVFAVGQSESAIENALVELEKRVYGDLFEVSMKENMDDGKTLRFIKDVYERQMNGEIPQYRFVMKTDMDSFVHLENLIDRTLQFPDEFLYAGRIQPGKTKEGLSFLYMIGLGYILSADLIDAIATSDYAEQNMVGPEDWMVGLWIRHIAETLNIDVHFVGDNQAFADHPKGRKNFYNQPFYPDAVVVHDLKKTIFYMHTVRYYYIN